MDPAPVDEVSFSLAGFFEHAGIPATLAAVGGLLILVLAIHVARQRGPRRHASALFAASGLAILPVVANASFGEVGAFAQMTAKWGDPPELVALGMGPPPRPATEVVCAIGLFLGLAGSVVAFARSREDAA